MPSHHGGRNVSDNNTLLLAIDKHPTSTTKALLVSVLAPRTFFSKNNNDNHHCDEHQETTTKLSTNTSQEELQAVVQENKDNAKHVEEGRKKVSNRNNIDTELVVDTDPRNHHDHSKGGTDTNDSDKSDSNDSTSSTEKVTPEEAAAVISDEAKGEQEVNVEALLRLAMQNLLEEWHLLNVPTYSNVMDKQSVSNKVSLPSLFSNSSVRARQVTSFIRMDVMARPASLGIILERLERIGIGVEVGTVSVFKAELCKTASPFAHLPPEYESNEDDSSLSSNEESTGKSRRNDRGKSKRDRHKKKEEQAKEERMNEESEMEWKNAATRLRVEQVKEQIVEQASFSFDFIALLMTASILAGVGLITNDSVVIVASMLVAPMMGPVLGMTFGTRVKEWPLVRMSFKNEIYALMGCVVIGAFIALSAGFTTLATETWPTDEMAKRGEWRGVLTGIAVAIPSGMGVCLSILGGNTSSLVGVAISASLLPPAVNAGICLMYSVLVKTDTVISDSGLDAAEFARIGAVSFALTSINIICIWLSGFIMFEIKEVAPTKEKHAFWAAQSTQQVRKVQRKEQDRHG